MIVRKLKDNRIVKMPLEVNEVEFMEKNKGGEFIRIDLLPTCANECWIMINDEIKIDEIRNNNINIKKKLEDLNIQRTKEVKEIKVQISNGAILDGDEISQGRISRTLSVIGDETIQWVADNGVYDLVKSDLEEALLLAGQEQTEIWIKYNTLKEELKAELNEIQEQGDE